jgi:hypothetical protein
MNPRAYNRVKLENTALGTFGQFLAQVPLKASRRRPERTGCSSAFVEGRFGLKSVGSS